MKTTKSEENADRITRQMKNFTLMTLKNAHKENRRIRRGRIRLAKLNRYADRNI